MLAFIILALINIIILMKTGQATKVVEGWTVYGTMGCGWTRKQLEYMKKTGKQFEFIDCTQNECTGVSGFPTILHPDGNKSVGYTEV